MTNRNVGNNVGIAIATITVWAAVSGLSYLFHSFGILSGEGAGWMVFVAFFLTLALWKD